MLQILLLILDNIDAQLTVIFHKAGLASKQDEISSEILKCTTNTESLSWI